MSNNMNEWAQAIHENAKLHGWWDDPRRFGEIIALCHSELSEALEADRMQEPLVWYHDNGKPEGVAVEMIDCMIRILDWCGFANVDVEEVMRIKHEYNKQRPYKHGKSY